MKQRQSDFITGLELSEFINQLRKIRDNYSIYGSDNIIFPCGTCIEGACNIDFGDNYTLRNILYGIEVKFYSARVKLTNELETEGVKNLFTIGDGAGVTRGLLQASASGVYVARTICAR